MCTRYLLAAAVVVGSVLLAALPSAAGDVPSREKIDKLIEQLGSDDFAQRLSASQELAAIGKPAFAALRKAAKSENAEVRSRALELLSKSETLAECLRAKRVHLVYKDTPLGEAAADFQKKSGYTIHLHDPDGKLKKRRITLDTGEATFWRAAELFGEKAGLTEGNIKDVMPEEPGLTDAVIRPWNGQRAITGLGPGSVTLTRIHGGPRRPFPAAIEHLILKEGKRNKWPTDDRGAIRIRAAGTSDMLKNVPKNEVVLALEVSREPKLQWQFFLTIRIDKAVDDRGQELTQVIPNAKKGITSGFGVFLLPAGAIVNGPVVIGPGNFEIRAFGECGGLSHRVPLQLRKGAKPAKSLAELKGVIAAILLAPKDKDRPAPSGPIAPGERKIVNIPFVLRDVPLPY